MESTLNPIDIGLRMVAERHRVEVLEDINLCIAPWSEALRTLEKYPDVTTILDGIYPHVIPYLIKGHQISPVHHIPYVVSFMARITIAEVEAGSLIPRDVKCGVLAALLHDIGIGDSVLPKITEEMIKLALPVDRDRLRRDGIASRREHMEIGVNISRMLLSKYQQVHPFLLSADDVERILEIVGTHDNSKIPLMEEVVDRKWLLTPGKADWLKHCHWEADALWMLSPAGILVDLKRQKEKDTPATRKKKFDFNLGLHAEIVTLYGRAFGDELEDFHFKQGLLYRSETGFRIAMDFKAGFDPLQNT